MSIEVNSFLDSLAPLKNALQPGLDKLERAVQSAFASNPWFIPEFSHRAILAIREKFLDREACSAWLSQYEVSGRQPRRVAIVMAGNVPLVGFHDLFCVVASGHNAVIKLSDKDAQLIRFVVGEWSSYLPGLQDRIQFTEKLEKFDAVIATGSNNTSRYFEYYFRHHPHILRKNRNGVALLTGEETANDLEALADDIFLYFGLGCRNISKIYVPEGYSFDGWKDAVDKWSYLADHPKYRHNLDYNYAIYIINQVPHIQLGPLILKEDASIASRIGTVYTEHYDNIENVRRLLTEREDEIQCVVSNVADEQGRYIRPGNTQLPKLDQYADGVDTMAFLSDLQ